MSVAVSVERDLDRGSTPLVSIDSSFWGKIVTYHTAYPSTIPHQQSNKG